MKKLALILLGVMCISQSGFAILSPLNQSIKELHALIHDPNTKKLGNGNAIIDIRKSEKGYVLVTAENEMEVDMIYTPVKRPGPVKFEFVFHDVVQTITTH